MAYPFPSSPSAHSHFSPLLLRGARADTTARTVTTPSQTSYTHTATRAIIIPPIAVPRPPHIAIPTPYTIPPTLCTAIPRYLLIISPNIHTPTTLTPTPTPTPPLTIPHTTIPASAPPPSPIVFATFLAPIVTTIRTTTAISSLITSPNTTPITSPTQTIITDVATHFLDSGMIPDFIGTILSAQGPCFLAQLIMGAISMNMAEKSIIAEDPSTGCSAHSISSLLSL
ncbi:hypothetical protein OG21DRAFT_1481202 [Imleria badia]|nr:hypothetical protein OG21DRAFT_1481202 [Imleria badia]